MGLGEERSWLNSVGVDSKHGRIRRGIAHPAHPDKAAVEPHFIDATHQMAPVIPVPKFLSRRRDRGAVGRARGRSAWLPWEPGRRHLPLLWWHRPVSPTNMLWPPGKASTSSGWRMIESFHDRNAHRILKVDAVIRELVDIESVDAVARMDGIVEVPLGTCVGAGIVISFPLEEQPWSLALAVLRGRGGSSGSAPGLPSAQ